jgi:carbon storage regulator
MLVLSRRTGEKIVIGDNIEIVVQRVAGGRVAIGVSAPESVRILRGELEDADDFAGEKGENSEAASPATVFPTYAGTDVAAHPAR